MAAVKRKDNKGRVLKEGEHQRSNGTYEYKYRDKRGKRHSIYAKTLADLRERETEVLRNLLDGIGISEKNLTINDLFALWIKIKRGIKVTTKDLYINTYNYYVYPDFGKTKLEDLQRTDLKVFYISLMEDLGLALNTVKRVHAVLHQVLEIGVENDYFRYNPSNKALTELKRGYVDEKKCKALTLAEQKLFESFLEKSGRYNRWYPIFTVMLWTGLRVGEVSGLRWCDVDFEKNEISVNHTLVHYCTAETGKFVSLINTPKSKAGERTVPMLPKVREALLLIKQYQQEIGWKCVVTVNDYTDFIFINSKGNVYSASALDSVLRNIIHACNQELHDKNRENNEKNMQLPHFSCHSLRHTFATRMCEAGVNIKALQAIMGHSDIGITLNIYTDATRELQQTEINKLNELLGKSELLSGDEQL